MKKVLIIVAHPDDEVLGMGGTIYRLRKSGDEIHVCYICGNAEARKTSDKRERNIYEESAASSRILGVKETYFGTYPNIKLNTVPHIEIVKFIENMIFKVNPDIVVTHYGKDINNDHKVVNECCDEAIRYYQRNNLKNPIKKYMYMEILSSTDWVNNEAFSPNCFIEIGKIGLNKKIEALKKYDSAIKAFPHPRCEENIISLATIRGCQSGLNYAEGFIIAFEGE